MVRVTTFFSYVTTIFPELIWLTKWKNSGHAHFNCVTTFFLEKYWSHNWKNVVTQTIYLVNWIFQSGTKACTY